MKKICCAVLTVVAVLAGLLLPLTFGGRAQADPSTSYAAGDVVLFGSYPQTKVTDSALITKLKSAVSGKTFTGYPYTSKNESFDYVYRTARMVRNRNMMSYCDFTYGGEKYRAVKINIERPSYAWGTPGTSSTWMNLYGYSAGNTYFFKWEPIEWIVLNPEEGFLLSKSGLDAQAFCEWYYYGGVSGDFTEVLSNTRIPSDYFSATIRDWLVVPGSASSVYGEFNFVNTAFSSQEKEVIKRTKLKSDYTGYNYEDLLFILSEAEYRTYEEVPGVLATEYATDYSLSQGGSNSSNWMLRSKASKDSRIQVVSVGGGVGDTNTDFAVVESILNNVRPAMKVDLTSSLITAAKPTFTMLDNSSDASAAVPRVQWNSAKGAKQYQVVRYDVTSGATPPSDRSKWTSLSAGVVSASSTFAFSDTTAVPGHSYAYAVRATGSGWTSDSDDYLVRNARPATPQNVSANFNWSTKKWEITWSAVSGAKSYNVMYMRTVSGASYSKFTTVTANGASQYKAEFPLDYCPTADWQFAIHIVASAVDNNTKYDSDKSKNVIVYRIGRLRYNLNGASGTAPESVTGVQGSSVTVTSTKPVRSGYEFMGWSFSKDSTVANYHSGSKVTLSGDSVLYAVWKKEGPTFTKQPADKRVIVGDEAVFTVTATGTGTIKYQWQYQAPGTNTWSDSTQSGAKTATLKVTTNSNHHGYKYRCVATDSYNNPIPSQYATLYVKPKITTQPTDKTVVVGDTAMFTVAATGKATLRYQWKYLAPGSTEWKDSTQTGAKTATLKVTTNVYHNGYQYYCQVTDGNLQPNSSKIVTLTVKPKFTSHPKNKTVEVGDTAEFTVTVNGKATIKYQWEYLASGSSEWKPSEQPGAKTATLKVATTVNHHGYKYRCVVTDGNGVSNTSNAATLSVKPKITKQPANKTVTAGTKVTFTVTANGKKTLSYEWQYKAPNSSTWKPSEQLGAKTATLSFTATANHNGYQYRCVVKDSNGMTNESNPAKLTIK